MRVAELRWFDSFLGFLGWFECNGCCITHQLTNKPEPQEECREKLSTHHNTLNPRDELTTFLPSLHWVNTAREVFQLRRVFYYAIISGGNTVSSPKILSHDWSVQSSDPTTESWFVEFKEPLVKQIRLLEWCFYFCWVRFMLTFHSMLHVAAVFIATRAA